MDGLDPVKPRRARRGFTLIEILLAVTILALMLGMAIVNFGAWSGSQALEEGAQRWETALRMARAEAANRGRRVRLTFSAPDDANATPAVQVLWEPEPLLEPGNFVPLEGASWRDYLDLTGIRVEACVYIGDSLYRLLDADAVRSGSSAPETDLADITFEPDGSGDSVSVTLVATDAPETHKAVITIDGMTGVITNRILTAEELNAL